VYVKPGQGRSTNAEGRTAIAGGEIGADRVSIFESDQNGNWVRVKLLLPPDPSPSFNFLFSVALEGDRLAVGAPDRAGSVYVFERHHGGTNAWGLVQELRVSGAAADQWGVGTDLSGDTLTAWNAANNEGATSAYGFERNASGVWK
jgi:hypothetical protein